ncbi:macrophage mannose receptor 1-like [Cloeon dipterum]|uniref:macrophage mannose receptor 1-like n=1 Tax=Cloeon dipterum TaxID=197152 RepID=UPI0032207164
MDLKILILLTLATQSFAAINQVQDQPTSSCDVVALGEALCDKRVEIVEEKLKGVYTLVKLNKLLCENQIRAQRESEEKQEQICEQRIQQVHQQCKDNVTKSATHTSEKTVGASVSGELQSLYPGSKYFISSEKLSLHFAVKFCKSNGMELVSIETEAENRALLRAISQQYYYWISGTVLGSNNRKFYWAGTGQDLQGFKFFSRGEPNNQGGNENCLNLKPSGGSHIWNDSPCESLIKFICELELS